MDCSGLWKVLEFSDLLIYLAYDDIFDSFCAAIVCRADVF